MKLPQASVSCGTESQLPRKNVKTDNCKSYLAIYDQIGERFAHSLACLSLFVLVSNPFLTSVLFSCGT